MQERGCDTCLFVVKRREYVEQIGTKAPVYSCLSRHTITQIELAGNCQDYSKSIPLRVRGVLRSLTAHT